MIRQTTFHLSAKRRGCHLVTQENPNAYDPWTEEADAELKKIWSEGTSIPDIAVHFGRKQGAIITRIKKLGL